MSAAEGQLFADSVKGLTQTVREQGPFDAERFGLQLGALETVLTAPRMRWLTGMERHLTEDGNGYGEKTDQEQFRQVMKRAALDEYQKTLVLESLKEGPQSVREMAGTTGLPVHTVSIRLNDLERRGLAELKDFEGTTPKFISLAV